MLMKSKFSTTEFSLGQLIDKVDTGELGLPELQRPFVWKNTKVRDLFDSMMRGYPVGYIMIWECKKHDKTKFIGTDTKKYDDPREVIIDGQQRLASVYAVVKGKTVIDSDFRERNIIISFCPSLNKFEVGTAAIKNNPEWIYNLSELFTSPTASKFIKKFMKNLESYRLQQGLELTDEEEEEIEFSIEAVFGLKNYSFPVLTVESDTIEEDASEIFVRINSQGVNLNEVDFILTQLDTFCRDSYIHNPDKATSFNNIGIKIQHRHIIRTLIAYAFNRGRLEYGRKMLKGDDLKTRGLKEDTMKENFDILKAKLPAVINVNNWHEFLKAIMSAGYLTDSMILSMNAVYYTYAMYLIAKDKFHAPNTVNRDLAALWFFHATMTSLYANSPESVAESHLNAIARLSSLDDYRQFIISRVSERLTDDYFSITLPGSEDLAKSGSGNNAWYAYVASLNILDRKVLFSHSNLHVSALFTPGSDGTKKALEKHHLFPKACLKSQGYIDTQINQMANYAFIDWNDNIAILDEAPAKYYPVVCEGMSDEEILQMEAENALPHSWQNMSYEDFLLQRRKLMAQIIKQGYSVLKAQIKSECRG